MQVCSDAGVHGYSQEFIVNARKPERFCWVIQEASLQQNVQQTGQAVRYLEIGLAFPP